jgi:tRNA-splicing ligase RtcB
MLEQIGDSVYEIKIGFVENMRVPARIYASQDTIKMIIDQHNHDKYSRQTFLLKISRLSQIPGIIKYSFILPDLDISYDGSISGVVCVDLADPQAVISPTRVGTDIGGGVRCFLTPLSSKDIHQYQVNQIKRELANVIKAGVGAKNMSISNPENIYSILKNGAKWAVDKGYGTEQDLDLCEERGYFSDVDSSLISYYVLKKGMGGIGTLGNRNHWVKIQIVKEIYDNKLAELLGLNLDQVVVSIRTGSRGLGNAVFQEYVKLTGSEINIPFASTQGQSYYNAMKCTANYSWCNRQVITHLARGVMTSFFGEIDMPLICDSSHNLAWIENHIVNGQKKELLIHRKGVIRSFGPSEMKIPEQYRSVGQPALIAEKESGDIFLVVGTKKATEETFGSCAQAGGEYVSFNDVAETSQALGIIKKVAKLETFISHQSLT